MVIQVYKKINDNNVTNKHFICDHFKRTNCFSVPFKIKQDCIKYIKDTINVTRKSL